MASNNPTPETEWTPEDHELSTTETNVRYIGYPLAILRATARTARSMVRYSAYASDVGESVRPIVVPRVVTLAYAISWAYVIGDVYWEGYKAYSHRHEPLPKVAEVVVERTIFQSLASIVLPMFIIHTQVKIFQKIFAKMPSVKPAIRKWGPTFAGFALIPFLPIIDRPVEHCLDLGKEKIKEWRN